MSYSYNGSPSKEAENLISKCKNELDILTVDSLRKAKNTIPQLEQVIVDYDPTSGDCPYVRYIMEGKELELNDFSDKEKKILEEFEDVLCKLMTIFGDTIPEGSVLEDPVKMTINFAE